MAGLVGLVSNLKSEMAENVYTPVPVTYESMRGEDHSWVATISAQKTFSLLVTGDVLLARSINSRAVARNDFTYPFENVREMTSNADVTLVNMETPLIQKCPMDNPNTVFCGDTRAAAGLVYAGVDVVGLANNHSYDFGKSGFDETVKILEENKLVPSYPGRIAYVPVKGKTLAVISYNDIWSRNPEFSRIDETKLKEDIKEAKEKADVVVVFLHWGNEYTVTPTERQIRIGHMAVDTGADLVAGNHPHWVQPVEIYKDKLIVYSHGNFVFDQYWSVPTTWGVTGKYVFYDNHLIDAQFTSVKMNNDGKTSITSDKDTMSKLNLNK